MPIHVRPIPGEMRTDITDFTILRDFPHKLHECSECRHVRLAWKAFKDAMEE